MHQDRGRPRPHSKEYPEGYKVALDLIHSIDEAAPLFLAAPVPVDEALMESLFKEFITAVMSKPEAVQNQAFAVLIDPLRQILPEVGTELMIAAWVEAWDSFKKTCHESKAPLPPAYTRAGSLLMELARDESSIASALINTRLVRGVPSPFFLDAVKCHKHYPPQALTSQAALEIEARFLAGSLEVRSIPFLGAPLLHEYFSRLDPLDKLRGPINTRIGLTIGKLAIDTILEPTIRTRAPSHFAELEKMVRKDPQFLKFLAAEARLNSRLDTEFDERLFFLRTEVDKGITKLDGSSL